MHHLTPLLLLAAPLLIGAKPSGLTEETVEPRWSVSAGPSAGARALAVHDGRVLVVNWDGDLVGLDAATGRELWRQAGSGSAIDGPWLGLSGGVAVLGRERSNELVGYAPRDGKVVWRRRLGASPTGLSGCPGSRLVAVTHRARQTLVAHAIDPTTGATLWDASADGAIIGAGGGYVFVGVRSGRGRLLARIDAYRCSDGARFPVPGTQHDYVALVHAAEGRVVVRHFDGGATNAGEVCVVGVEGAAPHCLRPEAEAPARFPLGGALLRGDRLYFSVSHVRAHNLDGRADSWLLAYDLTERRVVGRSPPLTASMSAVDAGQLLLTGFGSTGVADFLYMVDPVDMRRVRTVALRKAPRQLAVDAKRAYVATYDGRVMAVNLPLPGPAPASAAAPKGLFGWTLERVVDAHPKRGRTSGTDTDGAVAAVAFLPERRLVAAGNDDRVRVFDLTTGKRLAKSKGLGKDVNDLTPCSSGGYVARIYGGALVAFDADHTVRQTVKHGGGWKFGASRDCSTLVADDFSGTWHLYDTSSGGRRSTTVGRGHIDRRGLRVRGDAVWIPTGGGSFGRLELKGGELRGRVTVEPEVEGGTLVQAWAVTDDAILLTEHCSPETCLVQIGARQLRFDTRGAVWSPSVPSTIDLSPDGRFLVFHRDGLETLLVRVADGERRTLGLIQRTMSSTPSVVFAPDGKRFALAMAPHSHQVSVYALGQ